MLQQQKKIIKEIKRSSSSVNFTKDKNATTAPKSELIIRRIVELKDDSGKKLIQKYSLQYLITLLDKNKIQSIDKVYKIKKQGFNLLEFIRFFLNAIEHSECETLYLTMGLVDLFKSVSENNNFTERIKFIQLTDFVCSNILQNSHSNGASSNITGASNNYAQNKIQMKLIPPHKPISPDYQIKDYTTNPPTIYGNKEQTVYKLSLANAKVDKNKHESVVVNSYFSAEYKKIFSLDALADGISIYDSNCRLQKKLRPQNSKTKKDVVVLSFAYSQRQQRIGAVLKDFTLSFWDFTDNMQFQKTISTASFCSEYQTNIFYLEYFQAWITSDKTGVIYIWNLERQEPQRKIQCKFKGKINDLCEIPCLNILAVAQQGNRIRGSNIKNTDQPKIVLYNYFRGQEVGEISTREDMRIPHTLQYSQSYQVLLCAGFEKKINIFQINHKYLDTNLKGQLLGHQNLITNFILVKKTPMVVSSDDKGKVKIWDIRSYKCIQTLDFRDKTIITKLLDMVEIGKLGVMGSRVNFLEYDQRADISKRYQHKQKNLPLGINYIYQSNKLLIITKKDIRLYNMSTGAIQKIFCAYHSKDQQIVVFKYYELMKKVIIGNQKGQIRMFNLNSGRGDDNSRVKEERLEGFQNGLVTHIEYDQDNKLFLTCGENGTINVQKFIQSANVLQTQTQQSSAQRSPLKCTTISHTSPPLHLSHKQLLFSSPSNSQNKMVQFNAAQKWSIIRQFKGNFHSKDITTLAFSVYHGMIAIGSNCRQVYIWDYQYAKLLFCILLPEGIQPTAMTFLNGYAVLVIAAGNGEVFFVKLLRSSQTSSQKQTNNINPTNPILISNSKSNENTQTTKIILCKHLASFKDNRTVSRQDNQSDNKTNGTNEILFQSTPEQDPNDYITQLLVDVSLKGMSSSTLTNPLFNTEKQKCPSLESSILYLAYNSGKLVMLSLTSLLLSLPLLPHRKSLPTYNPERQLKEQFSIQLHKDKCLKFEIKSQFSVINPKKTQQSTNKTQNIKTQQISIKSQVNATNHKWKYHMIKPHHGPISAIKILQFDQHYLVTSGQDERVKLWDQSFLHAKQSSSNITTLKNKQSKQQTYVIEKNETKIKLLGDFNVNLPLPYLWNFEVKQQKKIKDKIMFSLKIIQSIFKKFGSDISTGESKILKLQNFFRTLQKSTTVQSSTTSYLTQPLYKQFSESDIKKKPYLFHEQFTKKDIHYEQIKKFNFHQIGGPSLRELQFKKKLQDMQTQWKTSKIKQQQEKNHLLSKIQHRAQKNQQKQQIINFLQDRQLGKKRMKKQDEELFPIVKRINQEFNKIIQNKSTITQQGTNLSSNRPGQTQFLVVPTSSKGINASVTNSPNNLSQMKTLLSSVNTKFNKVVSHFVQNPLKTLENQKTDKNQSYISKTPQNSYFGCFFRRNHFLTGSSKSSSKTTNPKGFQQYYKQKLEKDNLKHTHLESEAAAQDKQNRKQAFRNSNNQQLMQQKSSSILKHTPSRLEFSSLTNSRVVCQSSVHSQKALKKSQQVLSFQQILKQMNNRVLNSRQSRNPTTVSSKQNNQLLEKNSFTTQRLTHRLIKTHYGAIDSGMYKRGIKTRDQRKR